MVLASGRVCDEERKKNTGKCKEENRSRVERKRNVCSFVATDNYLGVFRLFLRVGLGRTVGGHIIVSNLKEKIIFKREFSKNGFEKSPQVF